MAKGRCAGCEYVDQLRIVRAHVSTCPEFSALFRDSPDRALDPAEEFARHIAERKAAERASKPPTDAPAEAAPKVSEPRARVSKARAQVPVAREPGPVNVEYWQVPDAL